MSSKDPSGSPFRILHLTAPGRFGGLETVVCQLSAGLVERGWDLKVVCRLDEDDDAMIHPFIDRLHRERVPVQTIQLRHRAYAREIRAVTSAVRRFQADILHTHGYHADVVGSLVASSTSIPRVATAHGFTGGGPKNRLYEYLQRRSFREASAVIAVSEPLAQRLSRDHRMASVVRRLPNAWVRRTDRLERAAARSRLGIAPRAFVVGWVGRVSREKGPDVAMRALNHPTAADLTLCMIGDGPLLGDIKSGSRTGSMGEAVRTATVIWPGAIDDAARYFEAFDVLVVSSRTEGSPMVILEAMDAEVPIVATRVGGVPDMLDSDEAWLVPPEDPDALRDALLAVRRDTESARARVKRAAVRLAREFAPAPWLDAHEEIYREAIASHYGSE